MNLTWCFDAGKASLVTVNTGVGNNSVASTREEDFVYSCRKQHRPIAPCELLKEHQRQHQALASTYSGAISTQQRSSSLLQLPSISCSHHQPWNPEGSNRDLCPGPALARDRASSKRGRPRKSSDPHTDKARISLCTMCYKSPVNDLGCKTKLPAQNQASTPPRHRNNFGFITRNFSAMTVQSLVNFNSWWTCNCFAHRTLVQAHADVCFLQKSNLSSRNCRFPQYQSISQGTFSPCNRRTFSLFLKQIYKRKSSRCLISLAGVLQAALATDAAWGAKYAQRSSGAVITSHCWVWCLSFL